MKMRILFPLLCLALLHAKVSDAMKDTDTLLVYFSDDSAINSQYYELLHIKAPGMNLKFISSISEFYNLVPEGMYNDHTITFGREPGARHSVQEPKDDKSDKKSRDEYLKILEKVLNRNTHVSYYFVEISSYSIGGAVSKNRHYEPNPIVSHDLQLVHYDGMTFTLQNLNGLHSMNKGFYKKTHIPLGEMHKASPWINPLYMALYLLNPGVLKTTQKQRVPCEIGDMDTVYITEILNSSKETAVTGVSKKFSSRVDHYKHAHIKLRNYDLANRAIQALRNPSHFYFYYYDMGYYYIIDALDLQAVSVYKAPARNSKDGQHKKYVKKSSKFRKKCT